MSTTQETLGSPQPDDLKRRFGLLFGASGYRKQKDFAAAMGVSESKVSRWLDGRGILRDVFVIANRMAGMGVIQNSPDAIILYLVRGGPAPFDRGLVADDRGLESPDDDTSSGRRLSVVADSKQAA